MPLRALNWCCHTDFTVSDQDSAVTVADQIELARQRLDESAVVYGHGTDNAWDEAVTLVLRAAALPDAQESLQLTLSEETRRKILTLLDRRIRERIPLAYLLGHAPFAGLDFLIEPGVVIPRSPIGELIAQGFEPWLTQPPARIVDLCCGCGCIGIAAALAFPDAQLTLVDVDPLAISLSRRNVAKHGLEQRAVVVHSDLFDAIPAGRFDLILSNPPYVDATDMRSLPEEYLHEPALGLAGGSDGLTIVRRIIEALPDRLSDDGILVCEVGMSAPALLRAYPRTEFLWPDLEWGGEGVFILSHH